MKHSSSHLLCEVTQVPPRIADRQGELLASTAVAPLEWDLEERALQSML